MSDLKFAGWQEEAESPSFYWQGADTLRVPLSIHLENREKVVRAFREKQFSEGIALLSGGETRYRNDTDHEELFRQESNFHYLFGVLEPDCMGMLNIATGKATLFIPRLPAEYAVWMGKIASPDEYKIKYEIDEVYYVDETPEVVKKINPAVIFVYSGQNSDSKATGIPAKFEGIEQFKLQDKALHEILFESRVTKSAKELELIKYTNRISSEAHISVMQQVGTLPLAYKPILYLRRSHIPI